MVWFGISCGETFSGSGYLLFVWCMNPKKFVLSDMADRFLLCVRLCACMCMCVSVRVWGLSSGWLVFLSPKFSVGLGQIVSSNFSLSYRMLVQEICL